MLDRLQDSMKKVNILTHAQAIIFFDRNKPTVGTTEFSLVNNIQLSWELLALLFTDH